MLRSLAVSGLVALASATGFEGPDCPTGDAFCQSQVGEASYCKFYQQATANCFDVPDIPCTCTSCPAGDSFCISTEGLDSYCKYWLDAPGKGRWERARGRGREEEKRRKIQEQGWKRGYPSSDYLFSFSVQGQQRTVQLRLLDVDVEGMRKARIRWPQ